MSYPHTLSSKKKKTQKSKSRSKSKSESPRCPTLKPKTTHPISHSNSAKKRRSKSKPTGTATPPSTFTKKKKNKNKTDKQYRIEVPSPSPSPSSSSSSYKKKKKKSSKSRSKSPISPTKPSKSASITTPPHSQSAKKRKSGKTVSTPLRKPKSNNHFSASSTTSSPTTKKKQKKKKSKPKPKLNTNVSLDNVHIDDRPNLSPKNSPNHKKKNKKKKSLKKTITKTKKNKNKRSFYGDLYSTKTKGKLQTLYKVKEKIGSGTFSTVRRGVRRSDKVEIAIKIITKTDLNETEFRLIKREIGVMEKLNHRNIVKLYDIFETTHHLYLIIEYCRGGELFDELINCTPSGWFSEREASQIIKQIAEALQYMHSKYIIHRDLKLENVLIAMKKNYKINVKKKGFSIGDTENNAAQSDMDEMPESNNKRKIKKKEKENSNGRQRGVSSHVITFGNNKCNKSDKNLIVELRADINNQMEDEEEYYSDSHNDDLDNLINRRHSEYISAIPHDLLYGNGNNNNIGDTASSIIIKISDFGLSKKLIIRNEENKYNDNDDDNKEKENKNKNKNKKKKKVNILSKRKRKKDDHVNDRQFAVMATNCGTLYYVAPEILNNEPYNEKVDMWSLGVICYVLLCGSLPFYSENELEISDLILACKYDLGETDDHWLKVSDSAKDLIENLLTLDKINRFSASQVLSHPFITGEKKLTSQKRKSVKWNAGSLLGKWPMKFRNILDSAKMSFGGESDIDDNGGDGDGGDGDSDYEQNDNQQHISSSHNKQKIQFKINMNNGNYLNSPRNNNGNNNNLLYSDVSELETEHSAIE